MLVSCKRSIRCFVVIAYVHAFTLQNSQVTLHLLEDKSLHTVTMKHLADGRLLPYSSFFVYPYNSKGGPNKLICSSHLLNLYCMLEPVLLIYYISLWFITVLCLLTLTCGVVDHLRALLVF